jgi:hypothetical protein
MGTKPLALCWPSFGMQLAKKTVMLSVRIHLPGNTQQHLIYINLTCIRLAHRLAGVIEVRVQLR